MKLESILAKAYPHAKVHGDTPCCTKPCMHDTWRGHKKAFSTQKKAIHAQSAHNLRAMPAQPAVPASRQHTRHSPPKESCMHATSTP